MTDTTEQCRQSIVANARKVADACLAAHGLQVPPAQTLDEARANETSFLDQLNDQHNLIVAASIWMQNFRFFSDPSIGMVAKKVAGFVFHQAEDCFYDQGDLDIGLSLYQLAAGLDLDNEKYLMSVITPCIQGDVLYPEVALPYAIYVSRLNPNRDETELITQLITQKYTDDDYLKHA